MPLFTRAVVTAHGPGIQIIFIPMDLALLIRSSPGSQIPGIPASLTSAIDLPPFKSVINFGILFKEFSNRNIIYQIATDCVFSGNKGKPTELGLYEDARSVLNWLKNKNIREDQIIIYGESLGTGVSVEVAQNKNFAGIILESPFTSMVDAGKHYYFYLPVSLLLKDRYETIKKLKNIKIPILVMHGENDKIVPFQMGKKVFSEANNPKYSYFPKDDDHMMEYNKNLLEALNKFFLSI